MPDPETRELQIDQGRRERVEAAAAQASPDPEEARTHERRAEKAAYLRDKLADRARSEDDG